MFQPSHNNRHKYLHTILPSEHTVAHLAIFKGLKQNKTNLTPLHSGIVHSFQRELLNNKAVRNTAASSAQSTARGVYAMSQL